MQAWPQNYIMSICHQINIYSQMLPKRLRLAINICFSPIVFLRQSSLAIIIYSYYDKLEF